MAVMLNLTVSADDFSFSPHAPFHFFLYIQIVALTVSVDSLWHVSCDLPSWKNMNTVVLSAEFELLNLLLLVDCPEKQQRLLKASWQQAEGFRNIQGRYGR
jgi:hypothetical protein